MKKEIYEVNHRTQEDKVRKVNTFSVNRDMKFGINIYVKCYSTFLTNKINDLLPF